MQEKGQALKLQDLGEIPGPLVIFGGPYSNVQALDALLGWCDARGIGPDQMICTGDIVAYCADGEACVEKIRGLGIAVVAGNCERQLAEGALDCGCGFDEGSACDILSAGWYPHALASISADHRAWMGTLPDAISFTHSAKRYGVLHGGASDIARFIWSVSDDTVFAEERVLLEAFTGPLSCILSGHSGIAFKKMLGEFMWVNAGTIGMPENDGTTQTSFAVLDDGELRIERLDYEFEDAALAMEQARLTQGYHNALRDGYWPSEDVLPQLLRRA